MTTAWRTVSKTWATNELVTAEDLNNYIKYPVEFLAQPPSSVTQLDESANFTTTSTSFVDVDSTDPNALSVTLSTTGGDVLLGFVGSITHGHSDYRVNFDVYLEDLAQSANNRRLGTDDGLIATGTTGGSKPILMAFNYLVTNLTEGQYKFRLQWKVNTGTATLYAGAGTSGVDIHPQFWAREV